MISRVSGVGWVKSRQTPFVRQVCLANLDAEEEARMLFRPDSDILEESSWG